MDSPKDWQLCKVNGDQWNGMFHRPTGTYFKVDGNTAWVIAQREPMYARCERKLAKYAVRRFWSGELSGAKGVHIPGNLEPYRVTRVVLPRLHGPLM